MKREFSRIAPSAVVISMCIAALQAQTGLATLTVEHGHPWTPPFGVDRVGRPLEAVVEIREGADPADEYVVSGYRNGKEISRRPVEFIDEKLSFLNAESEVRYRFGRVVLEDWPDEVVLWWKPDSKAGWAELARAELRAPGFEAEAEAKAVHPENPVDLGTIFPTANWLLLAGGQEAVVDVSALSRDGEVPGAKVMAWYESSPHQKVEAELALSGNRKAKVKLTLDASSKVLTEDTLCVAIVDRTGREFWNKKIHVMLVPDPPQLPGFGAVETKLRYDAPIPVSEDETIDYSDGWDPKLRDVIVCLPNGARFVFWRGSRNIPFWAGQDNTGFSYQWAERAIPFHWSEALLDHKAKFSTVEIQESTKARIHVRWHYRAVDEHGNAPTGDYYVEDFYFYPDGFGTRVLTLTCIPEASYELNEFIPITPAGGYPLRVLPPDMLDLLWIGGEKASFRFPFFVGNQPDQVAKAEAKAKGRMIQMPPLGNIPLAVPATEGPIYRVRIGNTDPLAVVQYNPDGWGPTWPGNFLPGTFGPQFERGAVVTRAYWGYHWPLSRVGGLGASDKSGINQSPAHNSIVTTGWTAGEIEPSPKPIRRERLWTSDANGVMKQMRRDTFVWLIGMSDAGDDQLRNRARSYREPPEIRVRGAGFATDSFYSRERRTLCLEMDDNTRSVEISVTPVVPYVNPVFEIEDAPNLLQNVLIDGVSLNRQQYAWDGRTLWLDVTLNQPAELQLNFARADVPALK